MDRDVFKRNQPAEETPEEQEDPMVEVTLFELIEAFKQVAERMDKEDLLEIDSERSRFPTGSMRSWRIFAGEEPVLHGSAEDEPHQKRHHLHAPGHPQLMKMRVVRAFQADPFGPIRIFPAVEESTDG